MFVQPLLPSISKCFSSSQNETLHQFSSVHSLSQVRLFATPSISAHQASLSITHCWSLPKPMSIESVIPSSHLILYFSLLLLPSIFPSIRVFSNESALPIRWPKYWNFIFNISSSSEHNIGISNIYIQFYKISLLFKFTSMFKWIQCCPPLFIIMAFDCLDSVLTNSLSTKR